MERDKNAIHVNHLPNDKYSVRYDCDYKECEETAELEISCDGICFLVCRSHRQSAINDLLHNTTPKEH